MKTIFKLIVIIALFLTACDVDKKDVICTEIFAAVTIGVTGGDLDEYYTIRTSTNDTIRPYQYAFDDAYVILDDNYLSELRNDEDDFVFVGLINNQVVVSEEFIIKADDCHVVKVSGVENINL